MIAACQAAGITMLKMGACACNIHSLPVYNAQITEGGTQ